MNLAEARAWRDEIRDGASSSAATVPTGYGPDGYFVQVWPQEGVLRLTTPEECQAWIRRVAEGHARGEAAERWLRQNGRWDGNQYVLTPDRRSPIDRMIDEACGR